MGDRDYKVVYRSRVLDKDEPRPRIATALDPYDDPPVTEPPHRRYGPRDSPSTIEDVSSATEKARSTTNAPRSVRHDDLSRDAYLDTRRSARSDVPPEAPSAPSLASRRSVVVDQRRDDPPPRRSDSSFESYQTRNRSFVEPDLERSRGRVREYHTQDRPRQFESPYIIETERGAIIDISVPSRERDRHYDRDDRRYTYDHRPSPSRYIYEQDRDRDRDRDPYARPIEAPRGGNVLMVDREIPPSRPRYSYDDQRSRAPVREYEYDREDDWRLVESMRDSSIGPPRPRQSQSGPQSRSRAQTYSSEDSYVMVSPKEPPRPSETSRPSATSSATRSAIARTDRSEPETRRRRSRSISFRDYECEQHDASERRHERPGAEADVVGRHLKRRLDRDLDDLSDAHTVQADIHSDYLASDIHQYGNRHHQERNAPYPPQLDHDPRKRDRSRRRRREDDADDGSYYSENVTKKVTKETRYR